MPRTAEFIDDLRASFGAEAITLAMREGLRDGHFAAIEAGHVVGQPSRECYERCGLAPPADAPLEPRGYHALPANVRDRMV